MKRHILKLSGIFSVILACAFITACPGEPEPELPPEPETPVYDTVTFQLDSNHCDSVDASEFYPGASLSVSYADENETPAAKIYYSLSEELTPENYKTLLAAENTSVKLYEAAIALAPTHNHEKVSISVIAENAAGEVKAVDSKSFYCLPTYVPYSKEEGYVLDGGLSKVAELIEAAVKNNRDVINIDLSGITEPVGGYVTLIRDKGSDDFIIIEDANTAIKVYGNIESTDYYLGEHVVFYPLTGEYYDQSYEVKVWSTMEDVGDPTDYLYYKNIHGLQDFSGLEDGLRLCGMVSTGAEYLQLDEKPQAYIRLPESANKTAYTEEKALFGYIAYNLVSNYSYFYALEAKAPFVLEGIQTSTIVPGVEPAYIDVFALEPGKKLEIKCVTPDATIYYGVGDNTITSSDKYTEPVALEPGIRKIRAYTEKNGKRTNIKTFYVMVMGGNEESVYFSDYGMSNKEKLATHTGDTALKTESGATKFVFDNGSQGNTAVYSTTDVSARLFAGNTITLESKRTMKQVLFHFRFPYGPIDPTDQSVGSGAAKFDPGENGHYDYTTCVWTGETKSVTFEVDTPIHIAAVSIMYEPVDLLTAVPEIVYGDKTAADKKAYLVDAGTEVVLTAPDNLDADIYYSTQEALTFINAKEAGTLYNPETPIIVNENTTVYAIMVTQADEEEHYSNGVWSKFVIEEGKTYAEVADHLEDGDRIYIFNDLFDVILSTQTTLNQCKGISAEAFNDDTKLRIDEDMKVLNVVKTGNNQYKFWFMDVEQTETGEVEVKKYLVSEPDTQSVFLGYKAETEVMYNGVDYSLWNLEGLENNEFLLSDVNGNKYLVYSETYKANPATRDRALSLENYHMKFFKAPVASN